MIGIDAGLDARVLAGTHHYRWPGQIRFMTCQRRVRLQKRLVDKAARAFPCGVGFRQHRRVAELWVLHSPTFEALIEEIGRAHVWTPVTNETIVCRLLLEKKKHTLIKLKTLSIHCTT